MKNIDFSTIHIRPVAAADSVVLDILRLDVLHPVLSGNKLFKLTHFLREANRSESKRLLTFGGAFSNHLHATAFACAQLGLQSIGLVRGNEKEINSNTLRECRKMGMQIIFLERSLYRQMAEAPMDAVIQDVYGPCTIIPAGGYGLTGARGASGILGFIPENIYSHICLPVGSATTLAGLMTGDRTEQIIAFPALKGMTDIPDRLSEMGVTNYERLQINSDFHFGGFAKTKPELIAFMNRFYEEYRIALDFVYTGKMMFGISALIAQGFFPAGSRVLAIHTGGLQGNKSLPEGTLCY